MKAREPPPHRRRYRFQNEHHREIVRNRSRCMKPPTNHVSAVGVTPVQWRVQSARWVVVGWDLLWTSPSESFPRTKLTHSWGRFQTLTNKTHRLLSCLLDEPGRSKYPSLSIDSVRCRWSTFRRNGVTKRSKKPL